MQQITLTASQALALSSPNGVTLQNIAEVIKDRLRQVGLASDFIWDLKPLRNIKEVSETGGWPEGPSGLGWRKIDIDYRDVQPLKRYRAPILRIYFRNLVCNKEDTKLVVTCIRHLFLDAMVKYRTHLRHRIVLLTSDPQDPNSFTHKALQVLVQEGLCDFGSMFLLNPENGFLVLSATTGLKNSRLKKDVFYTLTDKSWVRRSFNEQSALVEHGLHRKLVENRFGEDTDELPMLSRIFIPLTTQIGNTPSTNRWPVSGVFRLARVGKQTAGAIRWPRYFTWLDFYFIDFVGEVMHVVLQGYLSSWWAHSLVEKIVHGIKTGVDGSLEQVRVMKLLLFANRDTGIRPLLSHDWLQNSSARSKVENLLENAEFFLLDASEQVEIVTDGTLEGTTNNKGRKINLITRLFSDVLQKAVNLAPRIAFVNNVKDKPPLFNNLKAAGARTLPAVVGDDGLVLSVFRNLIENSVKYAKRGERASIEFSFEETDEFVNVLIQDNGIGVPIVEEKSLFTQGFRGWEARESTLKGRGIGLAYCKKIMEQMDGDLEYRRTGRGACFVVKLRKAEAGQRTGGEGE